MDFETLAQRAEKRIRQKMAVVKQDCDSFDIMPLDDAEAAGKKVVLSTKIDRFIASFSGGKDSQVVLDLCTRAIPPTEFEVIYSDTGYELPPSLELYKDVEQYYHKKFPALKFSMARNHESVLNYWDKIGTPSDNHRWCCSVMKTAPFIECLRWREINRQKCLSLMGFVLKNPCGVRVIKGLEKGSIRLCIMPTLSWHGILQKSFCISFDIIYR